MRLINYKSNYKEKLVEMIQKFFNEHRDMTKSKKEFYINIKEAEESLDYWLKNSEVYLIDNDDIIIGFTRLRYGGIKAAWLEDLYIENDFRGKGYGTLSIKLIDNMMKENDILAMFVDVIPRNPAAIKLYFNNGFDHLNMIQLRKNYDSSLNKTDKVEVLGFEFYKY